MPTRMPTVVPFNAVVFGEIETDAETVVPVTWPLPAEKRWPETAVLEVRPGFARVAPLTNSSICWLQPIRFANTANNVTKPRRREMIMDASSED